MFDFEPDASISREELLRLLRERISDAVPGSRLLAEGILGADSRIDFVAVEPSGRLAVFVVGEPGEDLAAIGRALAHRAWVEAHCREAAKSGHDPGVRQVLVRTIEANDRLNFLTGPLALPNRLPKCRIHWCHLNAIGATRSGDANFCCRVVAFSCNDCKYDCIASRDSGDNAPVAKSGNICYRAVGRSPENLGLIFAANLYGGCQRPGLGHSQRQ